MIHAEHFDYLVGLLDPVHNAVRVVEYVSKLLTELLRF